MYHKVELGKTIFNDTQNILVYIANYLVQNLRYITVSEKCDKSRQQVDKILKQT